MVTPTATVALLDKTPACNAEVRDECMLQIMSSDTSHPKAQQGLVDGLSYGGRYLQLQKANVILFKRCKSVDERIGGLSNF